MILVEFKLLLFVSKISLSVDAELIVLYDHTTLVCVSVRERDTESFLWEHVNTHRMEFRELKSAHAVSGAETHT